MTADDAQAEVSDRSALADEFQTHRDRLRRLAVRLLGSPDEADDVIQETWLRLDRAQNQGTVVENLGGWLTTVASRVCVDAMRRVGARREVAAGDQLDRLDVATDHDPAELAVNAASVTPALLAVLARLTPPERVAFVLHDTFGVGFAGVADVLGVSPAAARQLASRGRRKVRDQPSGVAGDTAGARVAVSAFLTAARGGDLDGLLAVLHPDAELTMDTAVAAMGAAPATGAAEVAAWFEGRAAAARLVLLDGLPGLAWWAGGDLRVVFRIQVLGGQVAGVSLVGETEALARAEVIPL